MARSATRLSFPPVRALGYSGQGCGTWISFTDMSELCGGDFSCLASQPEPEAVKDRHSS